MRWLWVSAAAVAFLGLGAAFGGGAASLGRVLLAAGLPRLAAHTFNDPAWEGVALYRAGQYAGAAEAFQKAGDMLNLGNAQAQLGNYAAALEAYDVARQQGNLAAVANFDLLAAYYAGLALDPDTPIAWFAEKDGDGSEAQESFVARGNARAAGTGDGVTNTGALIGLPELESHGRLGVRKVFDDKFMVANRRWLLVLEDVPGAYLGARILHERKRRVKLGLAQPDAEDPL